jgi:hypothetical protein
MKAWVFVVGFITCSVLFFLSGTLTGYFFNSKAQSEKAESMKKEQRTPSKNLGSSLISSTIEMQKSILLNKIRTPYIPIP